MNAAAGFEVVPLSPTIGAEIVGLDLRSPLDDAQLSALRSVLLDRKVLFFRDQDITTAQHLAFARRFGELEVHPFAPHKPGFPEVLAITHDEATPGRENVWHSDVTWRLEPSLGSVLRCLQCPDVGGDTLFSDMYAAFDNLPPDVKQRVSGLTARHDFAAFRSGLRARGASEEEIEDFNARFPNPEHPVIRTHPETGRQGIYVNRAFTTEIIGVAPEESRQLLQLLYRQATKPEYQCRFRWRPNSIAFWDNRACQHYATSDYWPAVRRVERVTIIGDTPFFRADGAPEGDVSRFRGALSAARRDQASAKALS